MPKPPAQVPESSALPREAGGFRLRREIGRGGMGVVYEAEEIASGRRVALKVLLSDLAVSGEAFERFQREARLAAAISHEHCVFVYGAHEIDGSPAIAMEIVDGETLEDTIRRGEPIQIVTAVRWAIDLIDGLEAAHRAGILHRDIKPSNCFVTSDGRVKIGDFGLSRTLERDVQLTQSGQFLGSPLYASPEQVRGRELDVRSDLYSCGATLYAILTGKPPYTGGNIGEVLSRILSEPPPSLRSIRAEIPRELESIVLRAMERDPEKRWRDLHALREALAPLATTSSANAAPWRRIGAYVLDSGVLALVGGAVVILSQALNYTIINATTGKPDTIGGEILLTTHAITYFFVGEAFFGTTIGKWLLGLRVVSSKTLERSVGGVAIRSLVFHGPSILIALLVWTFITDPFKLSMYTSIGPLLVLILLFVPARRSNAWRAIHDRLSGTIAKPVNSPFRWKRLQSPPPEIALEQGIDLPARVGDYLVEGVIGRTPHGRMVKARDATLERSVWIHVHEAPLALVDEERRSFARPSRLRWLGVVQTTYGARDVFESPGGTSLPIFSARHGPLEWSLAQQLVLSLLVELESSRAQAGGYALEQVWIDRHWNLRLLDEPVGDGRFQRHEPMQLVQAVSRALFVGIGPNAPLLPPDLPMHAETTVKRLIGEDVRNAHLSVVRDAVAKLSAGPPSILRRMRSAQLTMNVVFPAALLAFVALLLAMLSTTMTSLAGVKWMVNELRSGQLAVAEAKTPPALTDDQRKAREILVLDSLSAPWASALERDMDPELRETIADLRKRRVSPTSAEVGWAETELGTENGDTARRRTEHSLRSFDSNDTWQIEGQLDHAPSGTALFGSIAWALFALPCAFIFRGGLTFTIFGIRVRDRRGRPAGRWLCTLRCFAAWLPLALGVGGTFALSLTGHSTDAAILGSIVGIVYVAAVVHAMLNPAQSVVDRVLKTRLVPR